MKKRSVCLALVCWLAALGLLQACTATTENLATGSISGRVYFDENADEECAACECGIPEASLTLYAEACGGDMLQRIQTDADGYFEFTDVEPGVYCVYSGLETTCDGYLPTTSLSQTVELTAGEKIELDWFGYDLYIDSLKDD